MKNKYIVQKVSVLKAILGVMLLLVFIILVNIYVYIYSTTRHTLSEAKNAEFALRLLATEYYGKDQRIYDPLTPDGLAEGVAEEAAALSGAEGELVLSSWDAARRAPRSFIYTKDKIAVIYNYDDQEGNCWKLYYQFRKAAMPEWSARMETSAAE